MIALRGLLLAVAVAGVAAGAGASLARAGDGPAGRPVLIAPVPSPLPVPAVLLAAARRIEDAAAASRPAAPERPQRAPVQHAAAPSGAAPAGDHALSRAQVLDDGIALPPLAAPPEVRAIIEAGNAIARTPYKWGGGHGRWLDSGYDCSGSVSFALAAAGLLGGPLDSGRLMSWGAPGPGRWVTVFANAGHVFLEVAGVRFDTGGTRTTGSRWQATMRGTEGFVARHPAGL